MDISTTANSVSEVLRVSKGHKVLSPEHARALIKQAIGKIFGDTKVETDATTEVATIEARHTTAKTKLIRSRRPTRT